MLERHYEQQQAYIKNQEDYIRRNIAGQAPSRPVLERHLSKVNRIQKPLRDRRKVKFSFPETQRSGDVADSTMQRGGGAGRRCTCSFQLTKRGRSWSAERRKPTGRRPSRKRSPSSPR